MTRALQFLGLLIILAGIAYALTRFSAAPPSVPAPAESGATSTPPVSQWQWVFEPAQADASSTAPQVNVILRNGDTSYAVGTFSGSCADMTQSQWPLHADEGEIAGAVCWWAGGGSEIGVFSDEGRAIVRVGELDEGDAEHPGWRGDFKDLFAIDFGFIRAVDDSAPSIAFDDARWLVGAAGEEAAIAAGICTEETRSECLPNDYFILDEHTDAVQLPLAKNVAIYMLTWNAGDEGIKRQFIRPADFAALINDETQHWRNLPYNVSIKDGEVIMIEEVYVP